MNLYKKIVALMLVFVSALPFQGMTAESSFQNASPSGDFFDIATLVSPDLGTVEKSLFKARHKNVILIRDVHEVPEAQANIEKIIQQLTASLKIDFAGLEGAWGTLDPLVFRAFPDQPGLRKVFDEHASRSEVTAGVLSAVFAAPGAEGLKWMGMEDRGWYERGTRAYLRALDDEAAVASYLSGEEADLKKEKEKNYSPALLELDEKRERFMLRHERPEEFLASLAQIKRPPAGSLLEVFWEDLQGANPWPQALKKEVLTLESQIENKLPAGGEEYKNYQARKQEYLTGQLSGRAYLYALNEWVQALKIDFKPSDIFQAERRKEERVKNLEAGVLWRELEDFSREVEESLITNARQKRILQASRNFSLVVKLSKFELTPEEYREIAQAQKKHRLPAFFRNHLEFYDCALKRDGIFVRRLQEKLAEQQNQTALFVGGGFHIDRMAALLSEQGIGTVLIRPHFSQAPEASFYREHMRGNVSWRKYWEVKDGRVCLYDAFVRAVRDQLVAGEKKFEKKLIFKAWRDQMIRLLARQNRLWQAKEYTRFADEVLQEEQSVVFEKRREHLVQFLDGLRELEKTGKLDIANASKLLRVHMSQPVATGAMLLASGKMVGDSSRSELRAEDAAGSSAEEQATQFNLAELLRAVEEEWRRAPSKPRVEVTIARGAGTSSMITSGRSRVLEAIRALVSIAEQANKVAKVRPGGITDRVSLKLRAATAKEKKEDFAWGIEILDFGLGVLQAESFRDLQTLISALHGELKNSRQTGNGTTWTLLLPENLDIRLSREPVVKKAAFRAAIPAAKPHKKALPKPLPSPKLPLSPSGDNPVEKPQGTAGSLSRGGEDLPLSFIFHELANMLTFDSRLKILAKDEKVKAILQNEQNAQWITNWKLLYEKFTTARSVVKNSDSQSDHAGVIQLFHEMRSFLTSPETDSFIKRLQHEYSKSVPAAERAGQTLLGARLQVPAFIGQVLGEIPPSSSNLSLDMLLPEFESMGQKGEIQFEPLSREDREFRQIKGYGLELRRVIRNLVINALHATDPEILKRPRSIKLRIRRIDKTGTEKDYSKLFIAIEIEDNGTGIPNEVLPSIFEPKFTTKGERGDGVGLAMVKNLVEGLFGGAITVKTEEGKGTVFTVFLPSSPPQTNRSELRAEDAAGVVYENYPELFFVDQLPGSNVSKKPEDLLQHLPADVKAARGALFPNIFSYNGISFMVAFSQGVPAIILLAGDRTFREVIKPKTSTTPGNGHGVVYTLGGNTSSFPVVENELAMPGDYAEINKAFSDMKEVFLTISVNFNPLVPASVDVAPSNVEGFLIDREKSARFVGKALSTRGVVFQGSGLLIKHLTSPPSAPAASKPETNGNEPADVVPETRAQVNALSPRQVSGLHTLSPLPRPWMKEEEVPPTNYRGSQPSKNGRASKAGTFRVSAVQPQKAAEKGNVSLRLGDSTYLLYFEEVTGERSGFSVKVFLAGADVNSEPLFERFLTDKPNGAGESSQATIGRADRQDWKLSDGKVSRQQAVLSIENGKLMLNVPNRASNPITVASKAWGSKGFSVDPNGYIALAGPTESFTMQIGGTNTPYHLKVREMANGVFYVEVSREGKDSTDNFLYQVVISKGESVPFGRNDGKTAKGKCTLNDPRVSLSHGKFVVDNGALFLVELEGVTNSMKLFKSGSPDALPSATTTEGHKQFTLLAGGKSGKKDNRSELRRGGLESLAESGAVRGLLTAILEGDMNSADYYLKQVLSALGGTPKGNARLLKMLLREEKRVLALDALSMRPVFARDRWFGERETMRKAV